MLPMTMKKAYIATTQIAASQNASRTVRVDSASRPGCGTWRCIRTFLRVQGWWVLRADRSLGDRAPTRGPEPFRNRGARARARGADRARRHAGARATRG